MRRLYIRLVRMHPRGYRARFAREMIESFDEARENGAPAAALIADAFASLVRQWLLRPGAGKPQAAPKPATAGGPVFWLMEDYHLRPAAWFEGTAMAAALFGALVLLLGAGGRIVELAAWPEEAVFTTIDEFAAQDTLPAFLAPERMVIALGKRDKLMQFARRYFPELPVLASLDRNGDFRLSVLEIGDADTVLPKLDGDGDGFLSAAEAGGWSPPDARPSDIRALERRFFEWNPVLGILDADADLRISAREMRNAAGALRTLDVSGDGELGTIEIVPDQVAADILGLRLR
jgi:hypothetical protein